jgi:hypothetical protein
MTLFKRRKVLEAELIEAQKETEAVRKKTDKVEKLNASLQEHLKDNHIGLRLYVQMVQNWK